MKSGAVPSKGGIDIVLTSPPNEIADYGYSPFTAFLSSFPNNVLLKSFLHRKWFAPTDRDDGQAAFVPYGLRKVEAMLADAFGEERVAVVHPHNLERFVGPRTRAVGISSMDPMGLAYASTTYSSLLAFGGEPINSAEFKRLVRHPAIRRHRPRVIVGGSSAWQVEECKKQEEFGIDCLVMGEGERVVVPTFRDALDGKPLPKKVKGDRADPEEIPLIRHAATYGVVEVMRGCGRGCQFCAPTMRRRFSLPLEHIMKEVEVNVEGGAEMAFLATEDVFLYKSEKNFIPNGKAVIELVERVASHPGVKYVQPAHASFSPVLQNERMIEEISPVLMEKSRWLGPNKKDRLVSAVMGVETGSPRLMERHMRGKALPYGVKKWPELVTSALGILNDNGWYPIGTIITGWPDETEDDTLITLELLDDLKGYDIFLTPIVFVPLRDCAMHDARRASLKDLTPAQWDFIATCYRKNFDYWGGQKWSGLIKAVSLLSYAFYYQFKHGPRSKRPMLKASGLDESFIGRKLVGGCEPGYCRPVN